MTALATSTDLANRLGTTLTTTQAARADALLADASAYIRAMTGQTISRVVGDTVRLEPNGTVLTLPQRPVESVASVALVDGATTITLTGWAFNKLDGIELAGATTATAPVNCLNTFEVVYTHGYTVVPDIVIAVVCAMVNRTLTAPSTVDGLTSETIGQYSYQLQQGAGGGGAAVRPPTEMEMRLLARAGFRRSARSIPVRAQ